jgi:hypothetical protein
MRCDVIMCFCLLAFPVSARPEQKPANDFYLISTGKAGQAQIGMTVDSFKQIYTEAKLVDLQQEGMFSPALEVRSGELVADIDKNRQNQWAITRIQINDARYRTAKGISVGMTATAVRSAYPSVKRLTGEGRVMLSEAALGLSFALQNDKPTAKVRSILLLSR